MPVPKSRQRAMPEPAPPMPEQMRSEFFTMKDERDKEKTKARALEKERERALASAAPTAKVARVLSGIGDTLLGEPADSDDDYYKDLDALRESRKMEEYRSLFGDEYDPKHTPILDVGDPKYAQKSKWLVDKEGLAQGTLPTPPPRDFSAQADALALSDKEELERRRPLEREAARQLEFDSKRNRSLKWMMGDNDE